MRKDITGDESGTAILEVDESVDYLIVRFPDGDSLDMSIYPRNGNRHIKMYGLEDFGIVPFDRNGQLRDLDIWGPIQKSNQRGSVPKTVTEVEAEDLREE